MKVVRLSTLLTGYLYPAGNIAGTHFRCRLNQPQGRSAAGRIMSIKNSNDTIGNRTRESLQWSVFNRELISPLFTQKLIIQLKDFWFYVHFNSLFYIYITFVKRRNCLFGAHNIVSL
jgi:hypothetical protein